MCGFACTYGAHDENYGSLLDNLHVIPDMQSKGIGEQLLIKSAIWSFRHYPELQFYLYVLFDNIRAIKFYKERVDFIYEKFNEL